MADIFDFYVHDNRKITYQIAEPIMREDNGVTDFVFHIPKFINGLDMSGWAWWFIFVNAKNEKYSIPLTLVDEPDRPLEYNTATYTVDYAMSIKAGSVHFALEAINIGTGGAIDNEWHTLTYETKVKETLQGNQAEYVETESDIISALLIEVQNKVNQLVGGATPFPVNLKSLMTDYDKVYLYTGSEPNESTGYWYCWNGTDFVPGGLYGAGVQIDPVPTQSSDNAVSSGGVYSALQDKADKDSTPEIVTSEETDADFYLSDENGNVILELTEGHIKTKNFNSAAISSDTEAHGSNADDVDLDFADSQGHVLMRIKDGHIQTAGFDSSAIDGTPDFETYTSDIVTATSGTGATLTVVHNFKKGDRIACHINDGVAHDNYGNYASWYEGSTLIASRRRGNNGYFERTVKADCASISAVIGADEYTAGTSLQLVVYVLHRPVQPKIVTVAQDGTGMYTLLKDAVESITDANHVTNPYVIEVYPGTYDTLEGYDDETIAEAGTSVISGSVFQGLKLTNGISIRGVGGNREEIILTATLDPTKWNQAVRSMISALNIQGTGGIENLTIDAHNMRYCVHDDFTSAAGEKRLRTLKNVKFTGSALSYTPHMTTYGAGCGYPRDYIIEDCDFGFGLGIHTQGGFIKGCTAILNNCIGHNFRIGDKASADSDAVNDFIVNNCEFDTIQISHDNSLTLPHIRLMGTGNDETIIKCLPTDIYQINTVKTTAGLTVGKAIQKTSGSTIVGAYQVATNIALIYGIVVFADSDFSYIQRTGYIASNVLGLTGLSMGDYVTIDTNGNVVTGGTSANAIGVVKWVDDSGYAYIKLFI